MTAIEELVDEIALSCARQHKAVATVREDLTFPDELSLFKYRECVAEEIGKKICGFAERERPGLIGAAFFVVRPGFIFSKTYGKLIGATMGP